MVLSFIYYAKGETDKTIEYATKTLRIVFPSSKIFSDEIIKGGIYALKGDRQLSLENFNKSIAKNPNDPTGYLFRGKAHKDLKEFDKAIDDFNKTIELKPKFEMLVWEYRDQCYLHKGMYQEAISDLSKHIDRGFADSIFDCDVWIARGLAYEREGKYEKAIADYSKAIEICSGHSYAYYRRGMVHYQLGRCEQAIREFDESTRINPKNSEVYYHKALCLEKIKQLDKALSSYREYVNKAPSKEVVYITFALRRIKYLEKISAKNKSKGVLQVSQNPPLTREYCKYSLPSRLTF